MRGDRIPELKRAFPATTSEPEKANFELVTSFDQGSASDHDLDRFQYRVNAFPIRLVSHNARMRHF
jgi:hypothetical protein